MGAINNKFTYLSLTLFAKICINLVVVFYVAKKVDLDAFGDFILAFSYSTIFTMIFDYGFNLQSLILNPLDSKFGKEISSMIGGKLLILVVLFPIIIASVYFLAFSDSLKLLLFILTISSIASSFGNFFLNLFKVVDKYYMETIGYGIQVFVLLVLLVVVGFIGSNTVLTFAIVILVSRFVYVIVALALFLVNIPVDIRINFKSVIQKMKDGFSFATHLILGASIIYVDTFVLSFYESPSEVGIYQAGMRIIMASMLMSTIINDAYLPQISSLTKDIAKLKHKLGLLAKLLIAFIIGVSLVLWFFKIEIVTVLYTEEFLLLGSYFGYIIAIIGLRYFGVIPGIILTSFGRQDIRAKAVSFSLVLGVSLNFYLIPKVGLEGAFIASLFSHIFLNAIYLFGAIHSINRRNEI